VRKGKGPYGWQLQACPAGLVFNEGADRCDWPAGEPGSGKPVH